jgi:hypothetical protein
MGVSGQHHAPHLCHTIIKERSILIMWPVLIHHFHIIITITIRFNIVLLQKAKQKLEKARRLILNKVVYNRPVNIMVTLCKYLFVFS